MARGGPEPAALMLARQDKVDDFIARKRIGVSQKVESRQTPVHPVQPQVFRQPVFELVFPLMSDDDDR